MANLKPNQSSYITEKTSLSKKVSLEKNLSVLAADNLSIDAENVSIKPSTFVDELLEFVFLFEDDDDYVTEDGTTSLLVSAPV